MRIVVGGGRHFNDRQFVFQTLDSIHEEKNITELAQGAATGADRLAQEWATSRNIQIRSFPANWHELGKKAGPIRNIKMLQEFKPDTVITFPGGKGTQHLETTARNMGIPTTSYKP